MPVDLRSDTVTKPTPQMYEAMAKAELGDDVLGHDPTVYKLERLAAETVGKEAAIFVPSGTMGNQVALATHTNPGDSVLFDEDAHMLFYEGASPAVISGVQARTVRSETGVMVASEIEKRFMPRSHHTPGSTLLCLENTHNRAGGTVATVEDHKTYRQAADRLDIKIHLDGARVFNAATALGVDVKEITRHVDSVNFCLSKGLCAPVGSVLCGSEDFIEEAKFWRKRLGGGLRQAGILAACGIVSLTKMVGRLAEDHRRTKTLAEVDCLPGLKVVPPQTNILMIDTDVPAKKWEDALAKEDVWVVAMGPNRVRAVLHNDIDDAGLEQALLAFQKVSKTGFG